jgi:hypothetical protein
LSFLTPSGIYIAKLPESTLIFRESIWQHRPLSTAVPSRSA